MSAESTSNAEHDDARPLDAPETVSRARAEIADLAATLRDYGERDAVVVWEGDVTLVRITADGRVFLRQTDTTPLREVLLVASQVAVLAFGLTGRTLTTSRVTETVLVAVTLGFALHGAMSLMGRRGWRWAARAFDVERPLADEAPAFLMALERTLRDKAIAALGRHQRRASDLFAVRERDRVWANAPQERVFEVVVSRLKTSKLCEVWREPSHVCPGGKTYNLPCHLVTTPAGRPVRVGEGLRLRVAVAEQNPERILIAHVVDIHAVTAKHPVVDE